MKRTSKPNTRPKIKYRKLGKITRNQFFALSFLIGIVLVFVFTSDVIVFKREIDSIERPVIQGMTITSDGIEVDYYLSYDEKFEISIQGKGYYDEYETSINTQIHGNFESFTIPCNLNDVLPNVFDGVMVIMSGTMIIQNTEKSSQTRSVPFSIQYTDQIDISFSSFYQPVDHDHWETETHCSLSSSFIEYSGNISVSYDTYFELIQSEMDVFDLNHNGITAGYKKVSDYTETLPFQNEIISGEDKVVFDLTKMTYYKEYDQDVIDFCGYFMDRRIALDLDTPENTAPDAIYYFRNIKVEINGYVISIEDQSTLIEYSN